MRDAESLLRAWGAHWRARLEGCVLEDLSVLTEREMSEGDVLKEIEAYKLAYPRLGYEEAKELRKYGPLPRTASAVPPLPGMVELERKVMEACRSAGSVIAERAKAEGPDNGLEDHEFLPGAIMAVRHLVRAVYVEKQGTRSRWRPTVLDWMYPYSVEAKDRRGSGREATVLLVKARL